MNLRLSLIAGLASLAISNAPCDTLDLTPQKFVHGIEDGTGHYYFKDNARKLKVSFRVDCETAVEGQSSSLHFRFTNTDSADMKVSTSPLGPGLLFDEKGLEQYRQAAQACLPAGSTEVVLEQETPDVVPINSWSSYQFVFKYLLYGARFRKSVTFLNYSEKDQVVMSVGAQPKDYQDTYDRSFRILNSFHEILPNEPRLSGN